MYYNEVKRALIQVGRELLRISKPAEEANESLL